MVIDLTWWYRRRRRPSGRAFVVGHFLMENAEVANEIEKKIKEKLGIGAVVTADLTDDEVLPAPVDF
jgi:hypothetical protein